MDDLGHCVAYGQRTDLEGRGRWHRCGDEGGWNERVNIRMMDGWAGGWMMLCDGDGDGDETVEICTDERDGRRSYK